LALTNPRAAFLEGIEAAQANRIDFVYIKISGSTAPWAHCMSIWLNCGGTLAALLP
jgi:hypothetical protein